MERVINQIQPKLSVYEMQKLNGQQKIFRATCQSFGLPEPEPEYKFHPKRKWRTDYFFFNPINGIRVALEVEGGVFQYGRHNRASGFIGDMEKYNALAEMGILLVRVLPQQLVTKKTFDTLRKALQMNLNPN